MPMQAALTPRELEVAELIASGFSTAETASCLCLAPTSVRNHLRQVYWKLGVHDRLHMALALWVGRRHRDGGESNRDR